MQHTEMEMIRIRTHVVQRAEDSLDCERKPHGQTHTRVVRDTQGLECNQIGGHTELIVQDS